MDIRGTKSEQNVKAAFAGESQARNKYTYFAMQAKSEGHADAAELFEKMAGNETEHAKIWFKMINDGLGNTDKNLQEAAQGENYEWKTMYPEFAAQAREDGFEILAILFEKVAAIENDHEKRFLESYLNFLVDKRATSSNIVDVAKSTEVKRKPYRCMFCGNMEDTRLDVCPVCDAIGSFEHIGN